MSNIFLCRLVFELYKKCLDKDDGNKDAYIEYVLCSQIARMKNVKKNSISDFRRRRYYNTMEGGKEIESYRNAMKA